MNAKEGAKIIRSMADSLRNNPDQFHIDVNVTGQKVTSYGGTGLSITAVGGGPGSSTVGQSVSVDGAVVEIAQARGMQELNKQYSELLDTLEAIATGLEAMSPDPSALRRTYRSLVGTWVPGVVTSAVGAILLHTVGL